MAFLARQGMPTTACSIRREHVEAFIAAELERTAPSSDATRCRSNQRLFGWLDEDGEIDGLPMAKMRLRELHSIHEWELRIIPGLLQTPDYARAIMRAVRPRDDDETIERDVTARVSRQEISEADAPPTPGLRLVAYRRRHAVHSDFINTSGISHYISFSGPDSAQA